MKANENAKENTEVLQGTETQAAAAEDSKDQITERMAVVKIEGQEFELEASLAQDDKTLKMVLQPHFSSVENANITREVKDGKLAVTIVKKAQHKGCDPA